ncbi:MAG: CotH kinase family protein, partial [Verrucomicrobiota bacterium]
MSFTRFFALVLASTLLSARADIIITEFQARNLDTLEDDRLKEEDWIELHNSGEEAVNLKGWFLTDNREDPARWVFPDFEISPGAYKVLFASGEDRSEPQSVQEPITRTHTNFSLSPKGESVALIGPDGRTIIDAIDFPAQPANHSYGRTANGAGYFSDPTPGDANGEPTTEIGPVVREVTNLTGEPALTEDSHLLITAEVAPLLRPVATVELHYRFMFGEESMLIMTDDGVAPDLQARDGFFTASLPLDPALNPGEMIRWRVTATDNAGFSTPYPLFFDPEDYDQYQGTVVQNPSLTTSNLPVLHWFIPPSEIAQANTFGGTRCSLFYRGEFYENVQIDIHGQSTRGFPKKSYDFDFNQENRFRAIADEERVKDINVLTNWGDKSKTRNTVAYGLFNEGGVAAHWAYPIRMELNGAFYATADMVEDGDNRYLDRAGLSRDGALYKMYNRLDGIDGGEKKSRKWEGKEDLQALIDGLTTGTDGDKARFIHDHVDLPASINFLVMNNIVNNTDFGHKNYYLYRDTEGSGEWAFLPWDIDLSLGRRWTRELSYFSDAMETTNSIDFHVGNLLAKQIFARDSAFRTMFLHHYRTKMDRFYGPIGGVPENPYMINSLDALLTTIDPPGRVSDADLDYEKWGSWGNRNTMREAVERMKTEVIPGRRAFLYAHNEIPAALSGTPDLRIDQIESRPMSGISGEEYLTLRNHGTRPVDVSGWVLSGGIDHTLKEGTVLLPGEEGMLFLTKNAADFRQRSISPTGGEGLFVQEYQGNLPSRSNRLLLHDRNGRLILDRAYEGNPTNLQQYLRVTELLFAPLAEDATSPHPASDFEFLTLTNTGPDPLDLSGAFFDKGIRYTFPGGTILAPAESVHLARYQPAFEERYGSGLRILGPYFGKLSNGGERLRLKDPSEEVILDFTYDDAWSVNADRNGHSLMVTDAAAPHDSWSNPGLWATSPNPGGTLSGTELWLRSPGPREDTIGESVSLQVDFQTPQNTTFTLNARGLPNGITLNQATGRLTGRPEEHGAFTPLVTLNTSNRSITTAFSWMVWLPPQGTGQLLDQTWVGPADDRALVNDQRYPLDPTRTETVTGFSPENNGTSAFGRLLRGYLHAPGTGDYHFRITSDHSGSLRMEADGSDTRTVASVPGPTIPGDWNRYPGQTSEAVRLTAGQRYYFEIRHFDDDGDAHFGLQWHRPGQTSFSDLEFSHLSPYRPPTL